MNMEFNISLKKMTLENDIIEQKITLIKTQLVSLQKETKIKAIQKEVLKKSQILKKDVHTKVPSHFSFVST